MLLALLHALPLGRLSVSHQRQYRCWVLERSPGLTVALALPPALPPGRLSVSHQRQYNCGVLEWSPGLTVPLALPPALPLGRLSGTSLWIVANSNITPLL